MIAIDTNLLVYAAAAASPHNAAAQAALERARHDPRGWGVPFPALAEFLRLVTSHAIAPRPATPLEAAGFLSDLTRAGANIWHSNPGVERDLLALAPKMGIRGARIFDLQIALIARENGARELWTHDAGFLAIPGLPCRDPLNAKR